jgi:hypothetical protein
MEDASADVRKTGKPKSNQRKSERMNEECDHRAFYRVTGGAYCAIRYCSNCGKSWRMWTKPEYDDLPVAEWEPIREGLEVEPRVLPNYED